MSDVLAAITNTIPISLFNRGRAGQIMDELSKTGAKVVMKNNTPACVMMSPEEYVQLVNEANDARLYAIATERMSHYDPDKTIPLEEIDKTFGFNDDEIDDSEVYNTAAKQINGPRT